MVHEASFSALRGERVKLTTHSVFWFAVNVCISCHINLTYNSSFDLCICSGLHILNARNPMASLPFVTAHAVWWMSSDNISLLQDICGEYPHAFNIQPSGNGTGSGAWRRRGHELSVGVRSAGCGAAAGTVRLHHQWTEWDASIDDCQHSSRTATRYKLRITTATLLVVVWYLGLDQVKPWPY